MPPRAAGRSRSKSVSKKPPIKAKQYGGKSVPPSTASEAMKDILQELNLGYDSSVGVLNGDNIGVLPAPSALSSLKRLLGILLDQLDTASSEDEALLKEITTKLNGGVEEESDMSKQVKTEVDEFAADGMLDTKPMVKKENGEISKKRKRDDDDDENDEDQDDEDDDMEDDEKVERDVKIPRLNSKDDPIPPVQTDSFTQLHDTRLINPNTEFVTAQTLPVAAQELGLFSEETGGLENQGIEYLKRKYGVASYPERDLKDMLPGVIPDIDFSKNKPPANQVQFNTYQAYIEPYFRPFGDTDLSLLDQKSVVPQTSLDTYYDPNLSPLIIPKLGQIYTEVWADEDQSSMKLSSPPQQSIDSFLPKGSIDDLNDDNLEIEEVSCGPLSSRLLAALLKDEDTALEPTSKSSTTAVDEYKAPTTQSDYNTLEERLKRELKYIGIFMDPPESGENGSLNGMAKGEHTNHDWMLDREDDEVCAEIRLLQQELKEVVKKNNKRKKVLMPILEEQIAWQEYSSILDDLDKQIDASYTKRLKQNTKHKKKKTAPNPSTPSAQAHAATQVAQQAAANSGLKALIDKRSRWVEKIGPLFKAPELMKRVPSESIFNDIKYDEDDEEDVGDIDVNDEEPNENGGNAEEITI